MTFFPKIHGPVSTTMKLAPTSLVASSTLPIPPSIASTDRPAKLRCVTVASRYVQIWLLDMCKTSLWHRPWRRLLLKRQVRN